CKISQSILEPQCRPRCPTRYTQERIFCAGSKTIRLSADKNIIDITECDYREVTLLLSDEIVDLDKKVTVRYQGKKLFKGKLKRTAQTLRQTMQERDDYRYAFPAKVTLRITK
ncbi:MAG: hypothetical protein IJK82_01480, partial [Prevotella sp.]|nr:hypothetical protein [Prevotella sp.]